MDTPDPWAPDAPPHQFVPDPTLPASCAYRPAPGAQPCGYGNAHAIHRADTVQERARRGEVDAMARMGILAELEGVPDGPQPEKCHTTDCPWGGVWGATGRMPEGHHLHQVSPTSWYLAHDEPGVWPPRDKEAERWDGTSRRHPDRAVRALLSDDLGTRPVTIRRATDDEAARFMAASDRARTVRDQLRPHRFVTGPGGRCAECDTWVGAAWHVIGGQLSRPGTEAPRPLPGPAIPRGVIAPVVAGVVIGSAVGLAVAGAVWDSYRAWVAGRQVRRLLREAGER